MRDKTVRMMDMPTTIRGYTVQTPDGDFVICLNSRLSREQNIQSYLHELAHIDSDDFSSQADVNLIEYQAHK